MYPTVSCALVIACFVQQLAPVAAASASCPCLTSFSAAWAARWVNASCQIYDQVLYTGDQGESLCYPVNYGLDSCQTWDSGRDPFCSADSPPSWCSDAWCFVDPATCTLTEQPTPSPRTVEAQDGSIEGTPHYSYATCDVQSDFAKYRRAALKSATEIVDIVEGYVTDMREFIERQVSVLREGLQSDEASNSVCPYQDSCTCPAGQCVVQGGTWGSYKVDFSALSVSHTGGQTGSFNKEELFAQCLAQMTQSKFKQIGRLEYNDPNRLAFIQFGDQSTGSYFSWPALEWCPTDFDPRFRPWYVSAVSGPKDVVIVLDKSSSMQQESRWIKAVEGAKRVLDTLTEYDYAGIVLFSNAASSFEDLNSLEQVTPERLLLMRNWLDDQVPLGGTDFRSGFEKAFSLFERSKSNGKTSGCNKMVLFLTDGEDSSGLTAQDVTDLNKDKAAVFTFSFGDQASKTLPRSIACANRGIWYHVADGQDIAGPMSGYYMYYANSLAFQKRIRWREYKELITQNPLLSGCLPAYDRSGTPPALLGVVCMDVSVVIEVSSIKLKPDYAAAEDKMVSETSKCTIVTLSEDELERLRGEVSADSRCSAEPPFANSASMANASRCLVAAILAMLAVLNSLQDLQVHSFGGCQKATE